MRDCVIFRISPVDIVVAVVYIPPSNSKYSTPEYMQNLQTILDHYKDTPAYIAEDINSRYGELPPTDGKTMCTPNPDKVMNSNGRIVTRILREEIDFLIMNGLNMGTLKHDCDFTFFRGDLCSQIDIVITNRPKYVSSFHLLPKNIYSDHKPVAINITAKKKVSLEVVAECAANLFEYKHYDVNRKIKEQ